MLIKLKNKDTLIFDDFTFQCSIGKNGSKVNKFVNNVFPPFLLSRISIEGVRPEVEKLV